MRLMRSNVLSDHEINKYDTAVQFSNVSVQVMENPNPTPYTATKKRYDSDEDKRDTHDFAKSNGSLN